MWLADFGPTLTCFERGNANNVELELNVNERKKDLLDLDQGGQAEANSRGENFKNVYDNSIRTALCWDRHGRIPLC